MEQFEAYARQADTQHTNERAEEKKSEGQLRRLDREEQRLLDAYQAEIIELEQLKVGRGWLRFAPVFVDRSAFKAMMRIPQPTAFSALIKGYDGE